MIPFIQEDKNLIFNLYLNKYRTPKRKSFSLNHPSYSVCSSRTSSGTSDGFNLSTSLILKENQQQPIEIKYTKESIPKKPFQYAFINKKNHIHVSFKNKDKSLSLGREKSYKKFDKTTCTADLKNKIIVSARRKTQQTQQSKQI